MAVKIGVLFCEENSKPLSSRGVESEARSTMGNAAATSASMGGRLGNVILQPRLSQGFMRMCLAEAGSIHCRLRVVGACQRTCTSCVMTNGAAANISKLVVT